MGTGTTDDAGEFSLTTFDTDDGAVVGIQRVTVTQSTSGSGMGHQGPPKTLPNLVSPVPKGGIIPSKYADLKTTP